MSVHLRAVSSSLILLFLGASVACAQAPIIDAGQPAGYGAQPASAPAANNSSVTGNLYLQLQSLQQEVMNLRGIVEEQRHQLEVMKQQEFDRYKDLDQRITRLQGGAAVPADAASGGANPAPAAGANAVPAAAAAASMAAASTPSAVGPARMETAKPEEYEAYQLAYAKLKGQDFNGAIAAFNAFLTSYPNGTLAPNSYYWLGKAYLLVQPQDLNKAQQSFEKVSNYPRSNKVPDALYELGKVYFLKGEKAKAKTLLQQVIDNFGTSGSSAPQLAKQFLDQNFPANKPG